MDMTYLLFNALILNWHFIPALLLIFILKSAWFKGIFGEFLVNFLLNNFLPKEQYTLIKNVTLPTDDGTTQIDHIIVSRFGVFVIETKNMKGWIFGNAKQKLWTQKIFRYTGRFQNPLHQNYKHTKALASCLVIPTEKIYSVVVFIGDSTFKTNMPDNVTYARGCIRYIKSKTKQHFNALQVDELVLAVESGRLVRGLKTNRAHNQHVKDITSKKNRSTSFQVGVESTKKKCPRCGAEMILREAKKGNNAGKKFWGCSNFPKCRETINLVL